MAKQPNEIIVKIDEESLRKLDDICNRLERVKIWLAKRIKNKPAQRFKSGGLSTAEGEHIIPDIKKDIISYHLKNT